MMMMNDSTAGWLKQEGKTLSLLWLPLHVHAYHLHILEKNNVVCISKAKDMLCFLELSTTAKNERKNVVLLKCNLDTFGCSMRSPAVLRAGLLVAVLTTTTAKSLSPQINILPYPAHKKVLHQCVPTVILLY